MSIEAIIADFHGRGIRLIPNPPKLAVQAASRLTDADRAIIRARKVELLAVLAEQAEIERITRLDHERREADRQAGRGYDFDCSAPSHIEREKAEIDRLAQADGWQQNPAESIVATCQRYGVALRIDATTGDLVVGKAGAKADEPSQPWPSLLIAIEAHLEAVAALVASGWSLQAEFSESGAA